MRTMKSTKDKIDIMQAFLDGETIKLINHDDNNNISLHTKDTVKDLMWDWMGYDYEIVYKPAAGTIMKWVNVMEDGGIRNGNFHSSSGIACLNSHTDDVRISVKVLVKYEEVM